MRIVSKRNIRNFTASVVSVALVIFSANVAFAAHHAEDEAPAANFDSAWSAAEGLRKEAAELRYEWRDTGKILKQAKAAHAQDNTQEALALVAQAHEQSKDAIAQAEREKQAWNSRVPK